jgi:hypothetical protein
VVEVAAEHGERIGVQDGQQLVVGQPEPVLQQRGGGRGQKSWFSPPAAEMPRAIVISEELVFSAEDL